MRNRKVDIEKYLRGELSATEMHALEKEALDDPFLAEALEGVEHAGKDNFLFDLHRINRSVHDRSRRRGRFDRRVLRSGGWTAAIAATLLLIAVSGFVVINILKKQSAERQARAELAMLVAGTTEKDTVVIPLPHATATPPPTPMAEEEPVSRRASVTAAETGIAKPLAEEPQEPVTRVAAEEPQEEVHAKDADELLALESARKEEAAKEAEEAVQQRIDAEIKQSAPLAGVSVESDRSREKAGKSRAAQPSAQERLPEAATDQPRDATVLLHGRVLSANDGEALPGVNVVIKGTSTGTVTDPDGRFSLAVPADDTALQFSFIGFESQEVAVTGKTEVNVQLQEDVASLSEVVVTGFGTNGAPDAGSFTFATPEGGQQDFRDYLAQAVRYPREALANKVEGRVTIRFTVEPNGTLSGFVVLKGLGYGCEEEVIRAIREGPRWTPSRRGTVPLRDQVKVRYRFQIP